MKCTNKNCGYEWKPRAKEPRSCPSCKQYIKRMQESKNCLQCGTMMTKPSKDTWSYWAVRKFCSMTCKGLAEVGVPNEANRGERNGQWKGDDVSYSALHDYIKYHLPKPTQCSDCGLDKPLDLANISQEYKRDLSDWEWLCRTCHMTKDGRLERSRENMKRAREKTPSPEEPTSH